MAEITYQSSFSSQGPNKQVLIDKMSFLGLIIAISMSGFCTVLNRFRVLGVSPLLCCCQQGISGQVVGHVAQSDLGSDTNHTNATHDRALGTHCHNTKYMLNSTANFRSASITSLLSGCKFFVSAALTLNMFSKSLLLQRFQRFLGAICRVSPHILTGIAEIKQFGKYLAVVNTGIGHFVTANKLPRSKQRGIGKNLKQR